MEKINNKSLDLTKVNIKKLKELFPNVVTEGKIDFDALRIVLSDEVDDSKEKYQFTWKGKSNAIKLSQTPSSATLRPDKESSKNWDTTENLYIEGDNLEVLKQLQKTYYGKIKMIYIDPPYNTGNDFLYHDDFKNSLENYKKQTKQGMSSNPETSGRYHTDWLNMIYPRLLLSKNLLSDDGVIFISIDEKEEHNLRKICDEIFGELNFVSNIIWQSRQSISNDYEISLNHNHTLIYSKKREKLVFGGDEISMEDYINPDNDSRGPWKLVPIDANHAGGDTIYPITNPKTGVDYYPPNGRIWCYSKETLNKLMLDGRIKFGINDNSSPKRKLYYNERMKKGDVKTPSSLMLDAGTTKSGTIEIMNLFNGEKVFDYPKPTSFIEKLINYGAPKGGIILDFFSGSGTTAHSVMKINNKKANKCSFIMVQVPENLDVTYDISPSSAKKTIGNAIKYLDSLKYPHYLTEIGKERIRRAGEQIKSEWEKEHPSDTLLLDNEKFTIDIGFKVFKLDSTNIRPWDNENEIDEDTLFDSVDVFKEGRSKEDILYEIMLKYGIFDMPANEIDVNGKTMYRVGKRYMIVCLEDDIANEDIQAIANLSPKTVVFKESGFNNDNDKINAVYNLEKAGVEDIKCI